MARGMAGALLAAAILGGVAAAARGPQGAVQDNPFLGKWDITATTATGSYPYWLEVREDGGKLVGYFQGRGGAVARLPEIAREGADLVFSTGAPDKPGAPKAVHRAHVEGGNLVGELTAGAEKVGWVGVPAPAWPPADANARHELGAPVALFNGRDLAGWRVQYPDVPGGWVVADGALTNEKTGNNLVSEQSFQDFTLEMEYKLEKDSNSGLYLRGRYELQILDDAGKPPALGSHMALYGRLSPFTNASKPAGEWQAVAATLVGNRFTVVLNGRTVHNDAAIEGITGGALDSREGEPGPIMIQGDHSRIWVRKLVVTPIKGR